ncbi:MAG TPA: DUF4397 domain-containing protein [Jatrophihabitantaceae bacterium]|jgi:hypothetical protein|nr:DUF4397 domain-containing protein [Jatrophihabitantaceae bacterium]
MFRHARGRPLIAVAAMVWLLVSACVGPAGAAASPPPTASSYIRGAHLSPDTPGVDVYLSSFSGGATRLWLSSVSYGDVSRYSLLPPGLYAVSMRPHGAPVSTPPVLSWTLDAQPGAAYTAAAVGLHSALRGIVLRDQLDAPANGAALVRVIQAASQPAQIDVDVQVGPVIAHDASFTSTTPYMTVPGGTWLITARSATSSPATVTTRVPIAAASVDSLVVLNTSTGGLAIRELVDSAGTGTAPIGAVPAGGGGTATRPAEDGLRWIPAALVAVGLAGAGLGMFGLGMFGLRRTLRRPIR